MTKTAMIERLLQEARKYSDMSDEFLNKGLRLEAEANIKISDVLIKLAKEFNDSELNNKLYS